jgi:hypothetical protein
LLDLTTAGAKTWWRAGSSGSVWNRSARAGAPFAVASLEQLRALT